jgi:hypothetical protein
MKTKKDNNITMRPNLENPEILSDEIIQAIILIIEKCPEAIFGGSIALNAVGLLNRKISDIDLFFNEKNSFSLKGEGFLSIPTEWIMSDTVTNTNGKKIQRTGLNVNGIKVCAFKVNEEELQYSLTRFTRNDKPYELRIQNVNYAIQAKIAYKFKTEKHQIDLENIEKILADL